MSVPPLGEVCSRNNLGHHVNISTQAIREIYTTYKFITIAVV